MISQVFWSFAKFYTHEIIVLRPLAKVYTPRMFQYLDPLQSLCPQFFLNAYNSSGGKNKGSPSNGTFFLYAQNFVTPPFTKVKPHEIQF